MSKNKEKYIQSDHLFGSLKLNEVFFLNQFS